LLVRGGTLMLLSDGLRKDRDPDGYWRLAENVAEHGTFGRGDVPTAYRPPLYPLVLVPCVAFGEYGRVAVGVLHLALGVATVGMVLVLGRRWGLGRGGAAVAALLVACDPILLSWSAQVMTETLATFLTTAGLLTLTTVGTQRTSSRDAARQAIAGIVLALAALCRPAFLLWVVVTGVILWWQSFRKRRTSQEDSSDKNNNSRGPTARGGIASSCIFGFPWAYAFAAIVVLAPWAIRNQIQFGRPIVTTTHGGYTLLLANNAEFYDWLRTGDWGSVWQGDRFNAEWDARRPADEVAADRQAYSEAFQTIRREPGTFFHACLVRIGRFWSPLPHRLSADETLLRRLSRYAVAAWYLAEFALALVEIWRLAGRRDEKVADADSHALSRNQVNVRRARGPSFAQPFRVFHPGPQLLSIPWLWGVALVVCLAAGHVVYWTDMRMRAPIMPVVAMIAAAGLFIRARSGDGSIEMT
jgi:hypothetical protein